MAMILRCVSCIDYFHLSSVTALDISIRTMGKAEKVVVTTELLDEKGGIKAM